MVPILCILLSISFLNGFRGGGQLLFRIVPILFRLLPIFFRMVPISLEPLQHHSNYNIYFAINVPDHNRSTVGWKALALLAESGQQESPKERFNDILIYPDIIRSI